MCGIIGIVRFDGAEVDRSLLDRCTDALAHRGPDGRGTHIYRNVGLGHRRLAIRDLSPAGHQPMVSEDGDTVVVYNGELYGIEEDRNRLRRQGWTFRSQSDTEVLLRLYQQDGIACLTRLRGMFAFAIYDRRKRKIFLARDRLGKKPLKYFSSNGVFAFASEIKALQCIPECPREIDREAIHHALTMMYLPSPFTGIQNIHKLPAAHLLTVDIQSGTYIVERYWELRHETDQIRSLDAWEKESMHTLKDSVRDRLASDVPVGAFLSGGIDSAVVVALMSRISGKRIPTFCIGAEGDSQGDLPWAESVAQALGTEHHSCIVGPDVLELLPELVRMYEEPFMDTSTVPTYLIAQEARKSVTVVLTGDGGDENFAGYIRYPILLFSEWLRKFPRFLRCPVHWGVRCFLKLHPTTLLYRLDRFLGSLDVPVLERLLQYVSFFTEEEKSFLYQTLFFRHTLPTAPWYASHVRSRCLEQGDLLHQALSVDLSTYLPDNLMPKVDMGTMAHGLEARSPFLDHRLLELTAGIPSRYLLKGLRGKWILRRILRGILPPEILHQRKRGFRLPLDRWLRSEKWGWMQERLQNGNPLFWEFFERQKLAAFLKRYRESDIDYSNHVWALLWLEEWSRQRQ